MRTVEEEARRFLASLDEDEMAQLHKAMQPQLSQPTLEDRLKERGVSAKVRDRILRLNPNPQEGMRLRGWNPAFTVSDQTHIDVIGKGEFIRRFGRPAFERLPKDAIIKRGRHVLITGRAARGQATCSP